MITIDGLSIRTDKIPIIEIPHLEILLNKIYLLLGPNGSGKSTLANFIAGTLKEDKDNSLRICATQARINNTDLLGLSPSEKSQMGIFLAYQSPPEITGLNIFSFLHLVFTKHSGSDTSVREFDRILNENLEKIGLPQEIKARNFNVGFSGGERKKMEILQILLLKPKFVILDEIDSGVDIDSLKTILKVLLEYKEQTGATLFFITHNLNLAKKIPADEIFIMKSGQIIKKAELLKEKNELLNLLEEKGYESF